MRFAIFSDIHGNAVALDACLADLRERGWADVIVAAGDLCMDGPRPKKVLKRLEQVGALCLRGNTDRMIGAEALQSLDADDARAALWAREQIGDARTAMLGGLPFSLTFGDGPDGLYVCHANPQADDVHLRPDAGDALLESLFSGVTQRAIAFGHLHLAYTRMWRDRLLVNVASTGLPKDGDAHAHYAILTRRDGGWEVQERRVAYDVERVVRQIRRSTMPDPAALIETLRRHRYPWLGKPGEVIP